MLIFARNYIFSAIMFVSVGFVFGSSLGNSDVASAATQPPPGITSTKICVHKKTGAMRLPPNGKCAKGKERMTPFAAGPMGIQGPPGPVGPIGPVGPTGSVSGLNKVSISYFTQTYSGSCNTGRVLADVRISNIAGSDKGLYKTWKSLFCKTLDVYVP